MRWSNIVSHVGDSANSNSCFKRPGFTLIELVVVFGIIMVLIGLLLPALGRGRERARVLGDESHARQLASLVSMYTSVYQDFFPGFGQNMWLRSGGWSMAMEAAGLMKASERTSANGMPYKFTYTAYVDPDLVQPEIVPNDAEVVVNNQKISNVLFPSAKGMLWPVRRDDQPDELTWCCGNESLSGAIPFVDGSVGVYRWQDFSGPEGIVIQFWAGLPVVSTWNGIYGRDRK